MKYFVEILNDNENFIIAHPQDVAEMGIKFNEIARLSLENTSTSVYAPVYLFSSLVKLGCLKLGKKTAEKLMVKNGDSVILEERERPQSLNSIFKKINGEKLTSDEITGIITDLIEGKLMEKEFAPFVTAIYLNDLDMDEIDALARVFLATGDSISFTSHPVVDKHSIGGAPGNKTSLMVVPIIGAAGLLIPKTSSRAISSAAGTADLMEAVASISFSAHEIKDMVNKNGAVITWIGATNTVPADEMISQYEYPFKINPRGKMLASIIAGKKAMGVDVCVIDIPIGKGVKVKTHEEGVILANQFIELGKRLGMKVECVLTDGDSPSGRTIGVNLTIKEALEILENRDGSNPLLQKACNIAGILLELAGVAQPHTGYEMALSFVKSGKALDKLKEIIAIQGGDKSITSQQLKPGKFSFEFTTEKRGYVGDMNNKLLVSIAREAGSPADKGAGLFFNRKRGELVHKGDVLFTIYADKEWKLKNAIARSQKENPYTITEMPPSRITES